MTDSQLLFGIQNNNPIVWRYICRNLKSPFVATLKRYCLSPSLSYDDWEDIFQETCVILMENIKQDKFEEKQGASLFSYFVEIGKRTMQNALRKHNKHHPTVQIEGCTHILVFNPNEQHKLPDEINSEVSTEEKQTAQNDFIDKVFDSVPTECKNIFKMFYWDHKSMDEIASIYGLRNANSAKTKKTRCMKLFKDVKDALLKSGDYDEELIKAAAERASLRELLEDERAYCQLDDVAIASLHIEEEEKPSKDKE